MFYNFKYLYIISGKRSNLDRLTRRVLATASLSGSKISGNIKVLVIEKEIENVVHSVAFFWTIDDTEGIESSPFLLQQLRSK